ncbi:MAG TPA: hypothetical protein VE287_01920 [Actinopolymorphaceae bacterium]|nr:hypothetical protein [Actinopolymorphaceae bacterium]
MERLTRILPGRSAKVVERFAPTAGRVLGIITMAIGALILVDVIVEWRTSTGYATVAATLAVCTFVWLGLVRPSVVAQEDVLVFHNILRDTRIPWHLVQSAEIAPVLTVVADGRAYRSSAVALTGADRRSMRRSRRDRVEAVQRGTADPTQAATHGVDVTPADYTIRRIETMASTYAEASKAQVAVERSWRWPEFAIIAVTLLLALVLSRLA